MESKIIFLIFIKGVQDILEQRRIAKYTEKENQKSEDVKAFYQKTT